MESVQAVWHHGEGGQGEVKEELLGHSALHWPLHV